MEKDYNIKVLDSLYGIRERELQRQYIAKYGETEENKMANIVENDLINFMKKFIKNKEDMHELYEKINNFEIKDGMMLKKEINEEQIKNDTNIYDLIEEMWDYIDREKYSNLKKNDEYTKTNKRIVEIKEKYPNVRKFYEDNKIVKFTEEEMQALVEVKELYDKINILESEEIFRIGLRQGKSL